MKRITTLTLCLCMVVTVAAMDRQTARINTIKKDTAYIYSDMTLPSKEEAISQAYNRFQAEVKNWALREGQQQPDGITATCINSLTDTITTPRDDQHRVFVYARKARLRQLFSGEAIQPEEWPQHETLEEALLTEKPILQNDTVAGDSIRHLLKKNFLGRQGGVLDIIKKARTFFELRSILEPLKEQGQILAYGKYATMQQPKECYLIVYDIAGNIVAFLDKGDQRRMNLSTNKEDDLLNYRGCGAIWFKLGKQ